MNGVDSVECVDGAARSESGRAATLNPERLLHLAAAPTFALMALLTAVPGGDMNGATCLGAGSSPLGSMGLMYLLMSVFHASPWVRLAFRR